MSSTAHPNTLNFSFFNSKHLLSVLTWTEPGAFVVYHKLSTRLGAKPDRIDIETSNQPLVRTQSVWFISRCVLAVTGTVGGWEKLWGFLACVVWDGIIIRTASTQNVSRRENTHFYLLLSFRESHTRSVQIRRMRRNMSSSTSPDESMPKSCFYSADL
jgi:hypothetical protein